MVDNCGCCCFVASEASFLASKLGNKTDLDERAILFKHCIDATQHVWVFFKDWLIFVLKSPFIIIGQALISIIRLNVKSPEFSIRIFKSGLKRLSQRAMRHCFGYCCSCFLLWINFGSHSSMFWPKGLQWWMKWEMARNQYIVIMVMVVLASSALIELRPLIFEKRKQKAISNDMYRVFQSSS